MKEDFDPLVQIKKETDRLNQETLDKQVDKNDNNNNLSNPVFDNILSGNSERNLNNNKSNKETIVPSSFDSNIINPRANNVLSKPQIVKPVSESQSKLENNTFNRTSNQSVRSQADNDKELEVFKKIMKV